LKENLQNIEMQFCLDVQNAVIIILYLIVVTLILRHLLRCDKITQL